MSKPEKTPQQKLEGELASTLQKALGKPLNQDQLEQIQYLAHDVAHVDDGKAMASLDKGLESILTVTGLKASQIAPITTLVASYHPKESSAQSTVNSSIDTFQTTHKTELEQASKEKANALFVSITKDLEKSTGRQLDDFELGKVAELSSSIKNIGDPDGPTRFNKALEEFVKMAPEQASSFTSRIEEYHKDDSNKQKLVTSTLEPFKEGFKVNELNQQITKELEDLAGRKLTEPEALMVSELSQSVGYLKDKEDVGTLTKCYGEVVKNLSPDQAKPIIDLIDKYHKDDPNKQKLVTPVLDPIKGNQLFGSIVKDLQKSTGRQLDDFELGKVAELTSSVKNIGDPDGPARFNKALEEFVKMAPEQASSFIGRIEEYHKNELTKQALLTPALEPLKESVKANELNGQIIKELEGLTGRKLTEPELLTVSELSQSVAHIRDKEDLGTLERSLNEVVMNLTPDQAKPILDLVKDYHKNNPGKQELIDSALENVTLKKEPQVEVARDSLGSASADEITKAIRDEVITKQQDYLQGEIAKTMSVENGALFKQKTPDEVRVFLATPEGKDIVKLIMSTKEAQLAMNKIEVEGYKKVHETFKDSFKNVEWGQKSETKVRIAEITNEAGEKVASLKETTVDAKPTEVTLEDGTKRTIKSYREIDFPLELKDGKGPAHFSMAVKDENGRNISAKDAVYFTAHYDDNGKLTEVSSPVPVKFMGEGDDAIGYIERNGKVYTLPVTQGKYKEMMKEVAINNGLSVDLGQSMDSVSIPPRTTGVELQEPEMLKKSGPVVIDPNDLQTAKIVTIEPSLEMAKAVTVQPTLQMSKIVTIEPTTTPTFAEELQAKKANLTKTDRGAEVYGYDKPSKPGPDSEKPLTESQQFEKELQAKKANLTKTDRGAEVYGYDKPSKPGLDSDKPLTDAQKFEKELQAKKANLTKTDLGAEVYGYEKPGGLTQTQVETVIMPTVALKVESPKIEMSPIIEVSSVTLEDPRKKQETKLDTITLVEPKPQLVMGQLTETVTITVNPITGGELSPAVINKVQEIRQVLDSSAPRRPELNNGEKALEMLNGKTTDQALKAISTAIGKGDEKLVKAMMDIIDKPPKDAQIPTVGKLALNKVYTDQMESTKGMKLDKDRMGVQRACGVIAERAGIVDHDKRILPPKQQSTVQGR